MKKSFFTPFIALLVLIFALSACQKESFTTDASAKLTFSTDTLTFDTVFTQVGSTTDFFKIYNNENKSIRISNIELAGGANSLFRMNVNGTPLTQTSDIELDSDDSLYVFVEVTVDPTDENMPFLAVDSVLFQTNGNLQQVKLVAYGQNAIYYNNVEICDEVFTNEKPYLLYNNIIVAEGCTLTLKEGVRMHMHPRSGLYVLGTLLIEGAKDSLVTFEGDRLEDYFDDLPAQWGGIYILRGSRAEINYLSVNESSDGITVGFPFLDEVEILDSRTPILNIQNSIVQNTLSRCLLGLRAEINAQNCQFNSSNLYNIELAHGGKYDFTHCTVVNYGGGGITHRDPILRIANYATLFGGNYIGDQMDATFTNCIIHGSEEEEVVLDVFDDIAALPIISNFENCLLKTERNIDTIGFTNCLKNPVNADTLFVDRGGRDFRLNDDSPAINAGIATDVTTDLDGTLRDAQPDLGCFEFLP